MKKSEPKMILNVTIDNNELEEKVKIAMDKYAEQVIYKNLDETIVKIVEKRIDKLIHSTGWYRDKIQGVYFDEFVKSIAQNKQSKFVIGVLEENKQARRAYEKWGGKLSSYSEDFEISNVSRKEVFYEYDLK